MADNRVWIDERHYKILHDKFDDNGKKIGEEWITFTENETATHIFITKEWIDRELKEMGEATTFSSNYTNFDKKVVYDDAEQKQIKIMHGEFPRGGKPSITIEFVDGTSKKF